MIGSHLRWSVAAIVSMIAVYAARVGAQLHARTPVDRVLPFVALLVILCAWLVRETRWAMAIECAVPLIVGVLITIADDRTRLLLIGVIVACAFAAAALAARAAWPDYAVLTAIGVALLRWIPPSSVSIVREAIVLAGSLALLAAMRTRSPLALAAVLGVALVTPVHPGKLALFPFALAAAVVIVRAAGRMWEGRQLSVSHKSYVMVANEDPLPAIERGEGGRRPGEGTHEGWFAPGRDGGSSWQESKAPLEPTPPHPPEPALRSDRDEGAPSPPLKSAGEKPIDETEWRQLHSAREICGLVGLALLIAATFARYSLATLYIAAAIVFLVPLLAYVRPLAYAAALVLFAMWPWSGIVARALPLLRNFDPPAGESRTIGWALEGAQSIAIPVPPHVRRLVVTASGANASRFRPGRILGTIEATDRRGNRCTHDVRIGDVADFGFTRSEQFFTSRNPLPRVSPGEIRGYGASAWLYGDGRIAVACGADIVTLRISAARDLPPITRLQVESIEWTAR